MNVMAWHRAGARAFARCGWRVLGHSKADGREARSQVAHSVLPKTCLHNCFCNRTQHQCHSCSSKGQRDASSIALAVIEARLWMAANAVRAAGTAQQLVRQAFHGHHFALFADALLSGPPVLAFLGVWQALLSLTAS